MSDFNTLRNDYREFVYDSYSVSLDGASLKIKYRFEIKGLEVFEPEWTFPCNRMIDGEERKLLDNLAFSLGMVELISYWKAACPPVVRVLPHGLDGDMIDWWKALYFGGLGEFFYVNGIKTDIESFMTIEAEGKVLEPFSSSLDLEGNLVPVGGGKDSAVSLRLLSGEKQITMPYIINSRGATEETCIVAGYADTAYRVKRTIDKRLIELNKKGFLNGHTPFSAIVAFSSLISAVINLKKYVVLSNESSANESTVLNEDVNHQFSKGEEFERNFIDYQRKYIGCGVEYFSLLRPLSEMQIAMLFAQYKEYHRIFKSCNVGSKNDIWCCNCPKCLFVYVILSPFMTEAELQNVFGCNLLDKQSLLETYRKLSGDLPDKPFECVGSRDEVLAASEYVCKKYKSQGKELPVMLKYFEECITTPHSTVNDYMSFFDRDNHLPKKFLEILNNELKERTRDVPKY